MTKQEILDHISIKPYYEQAVPSVRWNGKNGTALCPWHADTNPSLSIDPVTGAFNCFGCGKQGGLIDFHMEKHNLSFRDALAELGEIAGLQKSESRHIVATYDYKDEQGNLLFQTVRYEPKDFRQRRPDGNGGWTWNLNGTRLVPYHLPEIIKAPQVIIVEGEKGADGLRDIGLPATCSPLGAGKWRAEYNPFFEGKEVVVLPDNDEVGRKHALTIARNLKGLATKIKIINLPGLPEKGDIADWFNAGHTKHDLIELIQLGKEWQEPEAKKNTPSLLSFTRLHDLLREEEENVSWVLDGMLPTGGFSLLAGRPKGGKTTLARNLAISVAQGKDFLSRSVQKGTVLYLALEEKRSEVKKHFRDMGASGDEDVRVFVSNAPVDALAKLREQTEQVKPVLIIVDPLLRFTRVRDGNDYAEVTQALEPLLMLARETGAHVLVVHHTGKGERQGGDSILGSTAIFASVDTAMILKRGETYRTIQTIQRYGQDLEEAVLTFDPVSRTIGLGGTKEDAETTAMEAAILEHLEGQSGAVTEAEIREAVEGRRQIQMKALRNLHSNSLVSREGAGRRNDPYRYSRN